ncbi:MAG: GNAT family N-acetyltransferase [Bacteroidales bacterium]
MDFTLRKWTTRDLESLVKHANNIKIARNMSNAFPYPYTVKFGHRYISKAITIKPTQIFAIAIDDEAVGSIGVYPQTDIHCRNAEMGYWLAEPNWGQGITTEAIRQMVVYSFNALNIDRIFARPFGSNIASQRVLEKAGFILEAKFEKTIFKNGEYLDELFYAIRK